MEKGKLVVISGPSGAGKSSLTKEIVSRSDNLFLSVSATTRKPRGNEKNGVDYFFLSKEEFEKNINENNFIEYANVHGNYYGTMKSQVIEQIENGRDIILEIDVQGGNQVKNIFPEALLIFVKTVSDEELEKRLRGRATDSEEVIQKRLKNSLEELKSEKYYDITLVNDDFEKAIKELDKIINGGKN